MAPSVADRRSELRRRVLSALVLAPIALAAVVAGSPWLPILVGVAAAILSWEWTRLCDAGRFGVHGALLAGAVLAVVLLAALGEPATALAAAAVGAALAAIVARAGGAAAPAWVGLGAIYLGVPCLGLIWLRREAPGGDDLILWLLLVTWGADIGAYAAGRTLGGPRLAPRISPNKTWSGLGGGLCAAASASLLFAHAVGSGRMVAAIAAGLLVGLAASIGDLVESATKRRFRVKDTSRLIPGHGGLLDRVDGLLLAAAVTALLVLAGFRWL